MGYSQVCGSEAGTRQMHSKFLSGQHSSLKDTAHHALNLIHPYAVAPHRHQPHRLRLADAPPQDVVDFPFGH